MRDWSNYSNIMYIFSVSNLEFKFDYRTLPVHMKVSGSSTHSQPGFANWSLYIQIIASLDTMTETFSQLHAYVDICQFNIWNTGVVLIMQIYWIFENIFFFFQVKETTVTLGHIRNKVRELSERRQMDWQKD